MADQKKNLSFPTTDWALLSRARYLTRDENGGGLEQLIQVYVPALRRYLVRVKCIGQEAAEDLLQSFVADRLLDRTLIQRADHRRGRFRNYLIRSLEHYHVDRLRHDSVRAPQSGCALSLAEPEASGLASCSMNPVDEFDLEWARSVVAEAIGRTHDYCVRRERLHLWLVFHARIVAPVADGLPPLPYKAIVEQVGFPTPLQASNALISAKRLFTRMLKEVLREQAGGGSDVDVNEEVRELQAILARGAASARSAT
jgi:DNA-directed RNA polymerase specialized sigma24 family protein